MAIRSFTDEEITARARKLADEQGPGWDAIMQDELVGKNTGALRFWRQRALEDLEADDVTALEIEADTPKTVGLD